MYFSYIRRGRNGNRLNEFRLSIPISKFSGYNVILKPQCLQKLSITRNFFHNDTNKSDRQQNDKVYTIPNAITLARIVSSPLIAAAIAYNHKEIALAGCVVAGFSDWLDGYIAKTYDMKSTLGAFLDPFADKVFIGSLTVGLTYQSLLPLPLAALIVGRDAILLFGSFYIRATEKPPGAAFFDTSDSATFVITPSNFSKANTGIQFLLLSSTLGNFICGYPTIEILQPLWWLTAITTVGSGLGYLNGAGLQRLSKPRVGQGPDRR